jgi:opacity protein-like surface antigen
MRISETAAVAVALLAALWTPLEAQRTRDRPTLIFTVSGAYVDGVGLWTVPSQPVPDLSNSAALVDNFFLKRAIKRSLGAGFSGTYYRGKHLGLTAEAFLLGLGYDDTCRLEEPAQSELNVERCNSIDDKERSAAAVATSVGAIYRVASEEFISPFVRAGVGFLVNNQSPLLVIGQAGLAELVIYDDNNKGTRLRPAFGLGAGATIAAAKGYQLRWEIRDNIVGIQRVTGVSPGRGQVPPHETVYKHLFSLNVGLDVILERKRGRRY